MPKTGTGTGWKRGAASKAAAEAVAGKAPPIRQRVLDLLTERARPMTAEEIAEELALPEISVKPRISELVNAGTVRDTGTTTMGKWGKRISLWERAHV